MERTVFETVVNQTIRGLPKQFRDAIKDVAVVIEPRPIGRRGGGMLLGLYEGVPATAWGREYSGKLPDKITLFQVNIEAVSRTEDEIPHIIRETLLHEIAHHFGFDHDKIGEMEKRWRAKRPSKGQ